MSSSGAATVRLAQSVAAHRVATTLRRAAVTSLIAFHGWLVWRSVIQERFLDPGVAARWLVAAVVLLGFAALRRQGLPLFRGRRALVLWLLVVLLHAHAALSADAIPLAVPEAVRALSHLAVDVALIGVVLMAVLARRRAAHARRPAVGRVPVWFGGLPAGRFAQPSSPRPPPFA